jgi:hypothetical protein
MKVELPVRWSDVKVIPPEEEEALRAINGDEIQQEEVYHYDLITLDLKDVRSFNRLDDKHTILRTYQRDSFCIGVEYEKFVNLWTDLTGEAIMRLKTVDIDESKPPKKGRKKKNDDDDFFLP